MSPEKEIMPSKGLETPIPADVVTKPTEKEKTSTSVAIMLLIYPKLAIMSREEKESPAGAEAI